jgi:hypothetical protein
LHVIENEGGVVEQFDCGGQGDAFFRRDLQTFRQSKAKPGADAFARAFEKVSRGLAKAPGSAGGVAEELFDQSEAVVGLWRGGATGGRHERKDEGGNLKPEGGRKKAAGAMTAPAAVNSR